MSENSRHVLVTGATSDIGRGICFELRENGFIPLMVGRNMDKLQSVANDLSLPLNHCFVVDNGELEHLGSLFQTVVDSFGKLSGLVCTAGMHELRPLKAHSHLTLHKAFQQNTISALLFAKFFSSSLYSLGNSGIVFISSTAALLGEGGLTAYSAAKGALISATRSLAVELAPRGLRVNCVSPGWIETSHAQQVKKTIGEEGVRKILMDYPLGFGKVEDVAFLVTFLMSQKSRWITGQNFVVDGGRTLL